MIIAGLIAVAMLAATPPDAPVPLNLWALQATQEAHTPAQFDPGLDAIRDAVADLPFDTYHTVKALRQDLPRGQETRVPLNERYSLVLSPLENDAEGRVRLELRVEIAPKTPQDKPVTALSTRLAIRPGEQAKVGGFKLDQGELVIVISPGK